MRNVSAEYLEAVRARARVDKLTGTIKLVGGAEVPLNESNISSGGVSITTECVTGEELEFGSAILSQLSLSIRTEQPRYAFYNAKVELTYHIQLADTSWYSLDLGVFKVVEADKRGSVVNLTGYDSLLSLDKDYDGTQLYGTPYELLVNISEICDLPFNMSEDEVLSFPNGDQALQLDSTSGCLTYRDCARVVAQMLAGFVAVDSSGGLVLRRFQKTPVARLTKAHRFIPTIADFVCRYAGLVVKSSKGQFAAYDKSVDEGLELTMESPAWDYGTEDALQSRVQDVLNELVQLQYTPCSFEMPSDPALECGDMLELITDAESVYTLVTGLTWRFKGRTGVDSVGKNPYLHTIKPKQTQIIRELQQQTTANKLIFYSFTNTADVVAEGTEAKPLASVTFVTVEDTSAMFLAQLPVVAAAEDVVTTRETEKTVTAYDSSGNPYSLTLTLTDTDTKPGVVDLEIFYYMNGSQVDYQLVESLTAGSHILSLFYPFSELKGNTSQKFEVRILATGGSVTVAKRAFRATVTGQGLSATTVWDGTLTIEEVVPAFGIRSRMALAAFTESVTTATQKPIPTGITEVVSGFSIRSRMTLAGFTEEIGVNPVWEKQSITAARLSDWTYADRYVEHGENGVQLRTSWAYQSTEQTIDEGRMTVVKAVTADLASVEEVTVSD